MTAVNVMHIDEVLSYLAEFQIKALKLAEEYLNPRNSTEKRFDSFDPYGFFGSVPYAKSVSDIRGLIVESGITFSLEDFELTLGIRYQIGFTKLEEHTARKVLPFTEVGHNSIVTKQDLRFASDSGYEFSEFEELICEKLKLIEQTLLTNGLYLMAKDLWNAQLTWDSDCDSVIDSDEIFDEAQT